MKFGKLLLFGVLFLALSAPTAKAQDGLGGLGLAYLFGYGGLNGGFNGFATGSYNSNMPYFSLHPPVYYGKRYARPYGASPFAAWPQLQASASYKPVPDTTWYSPTSACCPAIITNPYAPAEVVPGTVVEGEPGVVRNSPIQPLIIENPFFTEPAVQYTASRAE